jgi:hypothetical protein
MTRFMRLPAKAAMALILPLEPSSWTVGLASCRKPMDASCNWPVA